MRENRRKYLNIRLTPAERGAIERVAARESLRLTEATRLLIRLGSERLGLWQPEAGQIQKGAMQ